MWQDFRGISVFEFLRKRKSTNESGLETVQRLTYGRIWHSVMTQCSYWHLINQEGFSFSYNFPNYACFIHHKCVFYHLLSCVRNNTQYGLLLLENNQQQGDMMQLTRSRLQHSISQSVLFLSNCNSLFIKKEHILHLILLQLCVMFWNICETT